MLSRKIYLSSRILEWWVVNAYFETVSHESPIKKESMFQKLLKLLYNSMSENMDSQITNEKYENLLSNKNVSSLFSDYKSS